MIQVDTFKRPSPSPSRSSVRSDSRVFRQPRVIQVNRDAATMVGGETTAPSGTGGSGISGQVPECDSGFTQHAAHFRSRTFSDGFIRNTSLELLLGVDCDACLALAAERQCLNKHISKQDLDLICNCNIQQNNYDNCNRDLTEQRGHTLNIYDMERIKRDTGRNLISTGSHRSLDRKYSKSKHVGVSNYISKQLISYDPRNSLVQKIKRKLSNLKKMGGDAITKKHQNVVQLAEITSGSMSSLKKLSMLSIADKPQRRVNSQNCIFTASGYKNQDDTKSNTSTYANFSGNVDQYFDRLKDCNLDVDQRSSQKLSKIRSFENSEAFNNRRSPALETIKFSTLDNRSKCKSIKRQMSYNDFPNERFRERLPSNWTREASTCETRSTRTDLVDDDVQTFVDADVMMGGIRTTHAHCTCDTSHERRVPSIFYDTQVSIKKFFSVFHLII